MTPPTLPFGHWLMRLPLVAILRGIEPAQALAIGRALRERGFAVIEVPLNSPQPYESIELLARHLGDGVLIGAGTVLQVEQVERVAAAGAKLIVMPHARADIVRAAKQLGLHAVPGFATPSEAFAMLEAGADALKLFPAEANPPPVLKAMRAVLPKEVPVLPVGSITPLNMRGYLEAGANGFGLGSALYRAGDDAQVVTEKASAFIQALRGNV